MSFSYQIGLRDEYHQELKEYYKENKKDLRKLMGIEHKHEFFDKFCEEILMFGLTKWKEVKK